MGNLISRNSTATKAQLAELGSRLEASDAAIVAKEKDLVAKSNELERRNNEHSKLSNEADALRKKIEELDKDGQVGQQEVEKLEAELRLENVDRIARERTLDAMRVQQDKLRKDLAELEGRHQSSSEAAKKLTADRDAVEKDLKEAVEERTLLVQQLNDQVAGLSDELGAVRAQLELEKEHHLKLKNEMVSVKYSNFETLEATKKLLVEAQEKYKILETEHLRFQKASDDRKAKSEQEIDGAREAYKLRKKECEARITATEFDLAEAEMKNASLKEECAILRSRVGDEAAEAKVDLFDSDKHDSKTEVNSIHSQDLESDLA
jgi:chromosome segregation ATPase